MRYIFTLALTLLLFSCQPDQPQLTEPTVEDWRLQIQLPDAVLPVRLHLAADGSEAWFENGSERVQVPELSVDGNRLRLRFPAFNNTMTLHRDGDKLSGNLNLVKRGYEQNMPVTGERYEDYRFKPGADAEFDVTGRWAVEFTEDDGSRYQSVGEFDQQGSTVTGTFLTAKGDYRYLAGEVRGRTLNLSTFDGSHAFVFKADFETHDSLSGDFWSGTHWHESWTAHKDYEAKLPDAYSLTYLKDGYDTLEFSFPDLEGRPVSLSDEKYQDKVVLVTLSGTWCPNCADEVDFLSAYYAKNRDRGLEIITLLYEHLPDFDSAAEQGRSLQKKHGIEFDLLIAGSSDKTKAAETLPMLNHVLAFPTIIFIDRTGAVQAIHTGFNGPGTGSHYTEFLSEFEEIMNSLLN